MFDSRIKDRRFKPQWDPNLKKKLDQKKNPVSNLKKTRRSRNDLQLYQPSRSGRLRAVRKENYNEA